MRCSSKEKESWTGSTQKHRHLMARGGSCCRIAFELSSPSKSRVIRRAERNVISPLTRPWRGKNESTVSLFPARRCKPRLFQIRRSALVSPMLAVCIPPVIAHLVLNRSAWGSVPQHCLSGLPSCCENPFGPASLDQLRIDCTTVCVSQEAPTNGGAENSNCRRCS
ncbi:uncharacterized protein B0H64DRAFT_400555 [Chaetomium fimeti]|uniref:Uncharacterized protein n=1 Tax=Chaetomium fimeti TaxID=1854472 RepID=A0AAE0HD55_9PEZI|nr:hypothetical protein B0H64DRAFT_400555 [Chaetomium fimeti]